MAWQDQLREARRALGWSQQRLAEAAHVAEATIASYESGRRSPRRATLRHLARALGLDVTGTNALLTAAGFDPEALGALARVAERRIPMPALTAELAGYPWPCLVMNERYEIVAWNQPANEVAELDFGRDLPTPFERNLLRIAAMPHFAGGRVVNWDEIIGVLIGLFKHNQANLAQPAAESEYLARLIEEIQTKFSAAWPRLIGLWLTAPPYEAGSRITFPAVWRLADDTILRFNCILYPWNDFDAMQAFDWFPADGATWDWLAERASGAPAVALPPAGGAGAGSGGGMPGAETQLDAATWSELLRLARTSAGLSRAALERLSGVSKNTVDKYERGERRPTRETLLRLTRAMQLDTATTNAILTGAGFEPVASDWALILSGLPLQQAPTWFGGDEAVTRSWDQIQADINRYPWPCVVMDAACELREQNPPARRVLGVDIGTAAAPVEPRNLAAFVISPFARAHAVNWEEVATAIIPSAARAAAAGTYPGPVPAPLEAAVTELRRQDAVAMDQLSAVWREASVPVLASRITFPVAWRTDSGEVLTFHAVISWLNYNTAWAMDWHPADVPTWARLDRI